MKVCVNCGSDALDKQGRPVDQVYDAALAAKSGIIKLRECEHCGEYVDKFIEYEGCLVLLDLALQQRPAYRHTLINNNNSNLILKMVVLTLIVDGYTRWAAESPGGEFFERESEFYWMCGLSLCSLATFIATSLLISALGHIIKSRERVLGYYRLTTGLLLAYCSRFLKLGALLWGTESTQFLWVCVDLLYFLTALNVIKTLSGLGNPQSTAVAVVSHAALHLLEIYKV